ncbi:hypothetical protein DYB32_000774 [Aphanomyces invadans]|uniref:UDP-N-acetylglucosamine--peptide N-acetylglucosaminyltransferase SPINDLY n=1 Tax=Aphanomyces invadans TaxID=157072 RepID=A0A418B8U9_9STRA|nr:hypothetical protein DYB32_000774 [Aphanomyces invadans]
MDYHYAPAHFFRGAVASVHATDEATRKAVVQHLNRCIHLDPTITGAYIVRGGLYGADLRFNNALQDFKAAVTIDPTLDDIWIQIAIVFLTHYHDCDACAKACTRALKNDLGLTQALHLRGEALARQGNVKAAMRDFVRLVMMQPTDRFAHLMKGKLLVQLDHARPALYAYKQFMEMGAEHESLDRITRGKAYKVTTVKEFKLAVDANPTPENLCLLSESLHSMGDTEASLHVINLAIESDPACARSYVRRAQCYIGNHAYKTAILDYDLALTLADKSELYRMYYERALCRSQLLSKAWNQLDAMQRGERVPCYYENNFRPGNDVPATLPAADMNVMCMTAFIKHTYVETANDFARCMKASHVMCEPYIERAALYVAGGEFNRAYQDLATALQIDPCNLHAYISAGVLKCRFSMYTASIECFDQALKHHPTSALAYYNRGVAYQMLNVWAQAESDYTRSIALDPTNVDAVRNRGLARCHLLNFPGAAHDFEDVYKHAPDDMDVVMGLGYVYLKLSRFTEAIALFKSHASHNPTATEAYVDAGNTYFTMAMCLADATTAASAVVLPAATSSKADSYKSLMQQARHCYLRAVRINPTDVAVRLNLAALFRARHDDANATRQYDVVMAIDPTNQDLHDEKAMMLLENGRFRDAIEHMHAAVAISVGLCPIVEIEYALLVKNKSMALHEWTRRRQVMPRTASPRASIMMMRVDRSYADVSRCGPDVATAMDGRDGKKRRMSVSADDVLADKQSIVGIKKTLSMHLANRGKVYEQMQDVAAAREDYLNAIYFDPVAFDVYFHLGTLALDERKLTDAIEFFAQALVLNPKLGVAHVNLGVTYLLLDAYDDAMHHLNAAGDIIPDCGFVWANKACVHIKQGHVDDALRNFSHAMKCMPTFAPLYVYRGRVLASQKHLHDSMVDFAAALQMGFTGDL